MSHPESRVILRKWWDEVVNKHMEPELREKLEGRMAEAKAKSTVDHPPHYGGADNPYEVIKVLEAWLTRDQMVGFLKGNVIKYMARAELKGGPVDVQEALWYTTYLRGYEERHPAPEKVDGAVSRQLQKSMELNAKIKNRMRTILLHSGVKGMPWLIELIEETLRLG